MSYTFNEQLDFLSSLLGDSNTDTSSQFPLAQRKTEINHAQLQFARDSKCLTEYSTSTIASMQIAVPSDWLETFALIVVISGSQRLITRRREVSVKDLERYSDYAGSIPYYYYWNFSGTRYIKLLGSSSDINGATYYLYYFKKPTALSDTTDVSDFAEEYRQAPVYKAASNLLLQIGQYTRSQMLLQMYDRLVAQARAEHERHYEDIELPSPDLNIIESDPVDIQGQGDW